MSAVPDIAYLRECFDLDVDTGLLTWKERPAHHFTTARALKINRATFAGKRAGCQSGNGYLRIRIAGRLTLVHRVVFALFHGRWPADKIDHINGDPSDNRPSNLREVSSAGNQRNQKRRSDNTSGATGVSWCARAQKWRARIQLEGAEIWLGMHDTKEAAIAARKNAEPSHGFHPNHGRSV